MAHIDHPPPSRREVVERLRPKDVLTHCYRPFPNAPIDGERNVAAEITAARARGVIFDIGHGMGSLGFETASAMIGHGFLPDVISSDVHFPQHRRPGLRQPRGPCRSSSASAWRCRQRSAWPRRAPAKALGRDDLGSLRVGAVGDAGRARADGGPLSPMSTPWARRWSASTA